MHPAYADFPEMARGVIPVESMPGDQSKVVAAMIDAGDAEEPPRRLLLGSDAYQLVRDALSDRLAAYQAQRETALVHRRGRFPGSLTNRSGVAAGCTFAPRGGVARP